MSITPLLQEKTPIEIEGRNLRRGYREPAIGKVYEIRFEVDKELWDSFELVRRDGKIKGILWWERETIDDEPTSEATPDEKGPHGWLYQMLFKQGFQNSFELLETLEVERPDQVKEALYKVFETDSLTKISPARLEEWANHAGLNSLVTMIRQIKARVEK